MFALELFWFREKLIFREHGSTKQFDQLFFSNTWSKIKFIKWSRTTEYYNLILQHNSTEYNIIIIIASSQDVSLSNCRSWKLRLVPDTSAYHEEATQVFDGKELFLDVSHLYHGYVFGKTSLLSIIILPDFLLLICPEPNLLK